ncbi:hypothetical protein Bbelb_254820 [Branchiostoma belcheri]|nr:hypothetical protein Bbelb_254820 [Branchiostoma belcheri]
MAWDTHINNTVNKANRDLGFPWVSLDVTLKYAPKNIKEKAYKTFVRPILEYACTVWHPYTKKGIDKVEAVQRRAARFVLGRYHNTSSVSSMLTTLGWVPLEERRRFARVTALYKIQQGLLHCPIINSKLAPLPPRERRSHDKQLRIPNTRTQYRGGSFLPRTVKDWNSLGSVVVEAPTADTFVSRTFDSN